MYKNKQHNLMDLTKTIIQNVKFMFFLFRHDLPRPNFFSTLNGLDSSENTDKM